MLLLVLVQHLQLEHLLTTTEHSVQCGLHERTAPNVVG